ncbi:hypothetical protein B0H14DRAFT_3658816 [Mycena olivaceomarginata]|nr:hypothetical protein B0H14DRAFT_3658816 [Mycena olivaceomarginata]
MYFKMRKTASTSSVRCTAVSRATKHGIAASRWCTILLPLTPVLPAFELILLKATEIEAEVHKEYRGGSELYLKATQTLFGYLQDKDNSVLREAVSSGDLPVERFLKMAGCRSLGHECAVES